MCSSASMGFFVLPRLLCTLLPREIQNHLRHIFQIPCLEPRPAKATDGAAAQLQSDYNSCFPSVGSCQSYGPFLGTLNIRCRIIISTQTGTTILTTTPVYQDRYVRPDILSTQPAAKALPPPSHEATTNATGKRQANIRYPLGWQELEDLRVVLIVLRGQSAESGEHQVSRSLAFDHGLLQNAAKPVPSNTNA